PPPAAIVAPPPTSAAKSRVATSVAIAWPPRAARVERRRATGAGRLPVGPRLREGARIWIGGEARPPRPPPVAGSIARTGVRCAAIEEESGQRAQAVGIRGGGRGGAHPWGPGR